nr:hypothetical protein [Campylobacterota bacterium]
MQKHIYTLVIAVLLIGCGGGTEKESLSQATVEADLSAIKITQGEKREKQDEVLHQKELEADKKGFYYAYSEDGKEDNSSEETFTRVDAQRKVKNRVKDGRILVRPSDRTIDNPYQYVRIDILK